MSIVWILSYIGSFFLGVSAVLVALVILFIRDGKSLERSRARRSSTNYDHMPPPDPATAYVDPHQN